MLSIHNEEYNKFKDDTDKKINLINKKLNRLEDKINIIIDIQMNISIKKKIENIENNEEILKNRL